MAAIDKTRTDPPDKIEMGGGSTVFSSPAANHAAPLTAACQQQQQSKDSGGSTNTKATTTRLRPGDSTAAVLPQQPKKENQQLQKHPLSTKTTTFQIDDNNHYLPTSFAPRGLYENQLKLPQQKQQHLHPNSNIGTDSVHNNDDDIKVVLPTQDLKDLNSNTNHQQILPPGIVEPSESTNFKPYQYTKQQQPKQRHHEPEKLVTSSSNDPREYKDNFSWSHHRPRPSHNENKVNGQPRDSNKPESSGSSLHPERNNPAHERKSRSNVDQVSISSSSGTVLGTGRDRDTNLKFPYPRSSSPRLVQRQDHIEVPCDDVAIIDIENEDDSKTKSSDNTQPPSNRDTGIKSLFYIGDGEDATPNFEDDISRINSTVNSDAEITESSLVLPDVFSNTTCPSSRDSSLRSSLTETQTAPEGTKITYRKQKKAAKKKKYGNGNVSDQTDEEQSRSSGKGTRSSGSGKNSNWRRLRNTLKAANEMKSPKKQNHPLTREDSFLRKFSTRNHNNIQNSSNLSDEESPTDQVPNVPTWTKLVIQHDGNFMFYWLGVITLSVMYNLWTCIARQGFREIQTGCSTCWYFLDGLFDVIYILDIVVQFRTGYLDQGLMVYDSKKLRQRYFSSKVIYVDFLCLLPLDFVQIIVGIHPMLRFPRFLKIYRAFRFIHMLESRTAYPNFIRVVSLTHILFLCAHWFAAFYYMISEAEGFVGTWAYPEPVGSYADVRRKYLKSLYWSTLTLTTIGDLPEPANSNEYVFVIVSYLIGVFVFATIVGQVGNVINNRNASRQEFERLLDGAKVYMQTHNVPQNLQKRVQRWYDYVWSRGRLNNGDINSLGLLPDKLKTELAIHVNLETLKKVTIFQECQPEFLHDLVLKMKAYIFTPGDLICRRGEVAREMFIIADGLVEIISETGTILKRMGAGDFFGEIGILNLDGGINRRSADVRSVGYLELFVLSRDDILGAMKDHPEAESIIRDYGQRRLREVEAHRQRVKPLKHQDNTLDAPTGGQNVQNRLLMTLRSLSPAIRRSSQLAHTGRQSSLQNTPASPSSPSVNSKRCVTQKSSDSRGSSPSVKSGFNDRTTVRKTMSDFNYSSVESFREHLASRQGVYCEACGNAYYVDDNVTNVRGGGNSQAPRRYVNTVYSKLGNLFRKRMGGRRTRSVVYDTPPGMFRNLMWRRGEGVSDAGRLSLQHLKSTHCHNCNVTLKLDTTDDSDRSFNTNNNMVADTRGGSTEAGRCDTNVDNSKENNVVCKDTLQVCDEINGSENGPSFGSKIARVIQDKIGWSGNVSYTPVSRGDNDEDDVDVDNDDDDDDDDCGGDDDDVETGVGKNTEKADVCSVNHNLDVSDNSEKLLLSNELGGTNKRAYLRHRTQSLGSEVKSNSFLKVPDKQQACVRFSPPSSGSLEHSHESKHRSANDVDISSVFTSPERPVPYLAPRSSLDATHKTISESKRSVGNLPDYDQSEKLTRNSSQSHPDLTTNGRQQSAKLLPQRRSTTTAVVSPSVLRYTPSASSCSPGPNFLLPEKCMVTPHPTLAKDLLQTVSHVQQHELRSSEFSSILHSTTPVGDPQSRVSAGKSSGERRRDSTHRPQSQPPSRSVTWDTDTGSLPDHEPNTKDSQGPLDHHTNNHLWDDRPQSAHSSHQICHHSNAYTTHHHENEDRPRAHDVHSEAMQTHNRTREKRRCKSCGWGTTGQKRKKGVSIFSPRRTCSIPDLLGDAGFLLSLRMRRTSSLDEKLFRTPRQSSCRSDSISRDGSGKRGRSKAMSIMQTPTHDLAFQHLAEQINSMQDMIDTRLSSIEESYTSTASRLDRLAASHDILTRLFKKVIHDTATTRMETQCEDVDSLHSSCV